MRLTFEQETRVRGETVMSAFAPDYNNPVMQAAKINPGRLAALIYRESKADAEMATALQMAGAAHIANKIARNVRRRNDAADKEKTNLDTQDINSL